MWVAYGLISFDHCDRAVLVELGHLELQEVDRFVPNGKIMQQPAWTYKRQQQHIKYG